MLYIANAIFAIIVGLGNGWIAKQLEFNKVTNKRLNNIFKGQWHTFFMLPLRLFVPIAFAYFDGNLIGGAVAGLVIQFVSYDSLIDVARGKFGWKYVATCEGKWDFADCFWLKLQEWHINHLVVKFLISALAIYLTI